MLLVWNINFEAISFTCSEVKTSLTACFIAKTLYIFVNVDQKIYVANPQTQNAIVE
jgi:hypothetical protein